MSPAGLMAVVLDGLAAHEWKVVHWDETDTDGTVEIAPSDGEAPWPVFVTVADGRCRVQSILPEVPVERRKPVALAMVRANNGLLLGRFDLDLDDGDARFVTTAELGDPPPEADAVGRIVSRVLGRNLRTVAAYADALGAVIAGAEPDEAVHAAEAG